MKTGAALVRWMPPFLLGFASLQAATVLVPAGRARPALPVIEVEAGRVAQIDLLTTNPIATQGEYRYSLYLLGGPLAALVCAESGALLAMPEAENGMRLALRVEIPSSAPGTRFLFKVERVEPAGLSAQVLGETELRVTAPAADLNTLSPSFWVAAASPRLNEFVNAQQWPTEQRRGRDARGILLQEDDGEVRTEFAGRVEAVVICRESAGAAARITAVLEGRTWIVRAVLPRFARLRDDAGAQAELLEVLRFTLQLARPSTSTAFRP